MADALVPKKHWATARADALIGSMERSAEPGAIAPYVARAGSAFGHVGIAAIVAVSLGAADAAFGPEPGGFSTDGALAVTALLLSVATHGSAVSDYALTNGVMLSGMLLRRKTAQLMRDMAADAGDKGEPERGAQRTPDNDPIIKFAKERAST